MGYFFKKLNLTTNHMECSFIFQNNGGNSLEDLLPGLHPPPLDCMSPFMQLNSGRNLIVVAGYWGKDILQASN
jgi:hypothetical protein